jgi:hypothetical protein
VGEAAELSAPGLDQDHGFVDQFFHLRSTCLLLFASALGLIAFALGGLGPGFQ